MIEPIDYVGALRRGWRLLVVLAVVVAVIAVLVPVGKAKTGGGKLRWTATAVVGSVSASGSGPLAPTTLVILADSVSVKQNAIHLAGLDSEYYALSPFMFANLYNLGQPHTTTSGKPPKFNKFSVVELSAPGRTSLQSTALANAYSASLAYAAAGAVAAAQNQTTGSVNTGYDVIQPAVNGAAVKTARASSSLGSSRKVRGLVGLVVGLLLAAAIVLIREAMDRTLRSAERAERAFRYPVLVEIPERLSPDGKLQYPSLLDVVDRPSSSAAEAYRMLRMSVLFEPLAANHVPQDSFSGSLDTWAAPAPVDYQKPAAGSRQIVLVVSPANEETRPVVAANLGATYAEAGQRVLVISTGDLDFTSPSESLDEPDRSISTAAVAEQLEPSSLPNVSRLSVRHFVRNGGQLVNRAPSLFDAARPLADIIIVETPPLLTSHHGEALVHAVDAIVVVGEAGTTTSDQARRAGDLLRRLGAPVLGVVLTKVRLAADDIRKDRDGGPAQEGQLSAGDPPEVDDNLVLEAAPSGTDAT